MLLPLYLTMILLMWDGPFKYAIAGGAGAAVGATVGSILLIKVAQSVLKRKRRA